MERYCDKGGGEGRIRRRGKRGGGRGKRGKYTSKNFPTITCMVDLISQNLEPGKKFQGSAHDSAEEQAAPDYVPTPIGKGF